MSVLFHDTCHDPVGDVELIAYILNPSQPMGALKAAADLLCRCGGLAGVALAEPHVLRQTPGVGQASAARLLATLEAAHRLNRRAPRPPTITSAADAAAWLSPTLRELTVEELHALYVDRRNRVIAHRKLTRGSDGFTIVDPKQVYRSAVHLGSAGVLMAHNHPSGDPTPSEMDREVTLRTARAGQVLGIRLIDHLIVAGDRWTSLAQLGYLPSMFPDGPVAATGP